MKATTVLKFFLIAGFGFFLVGLYFYDSTARFVERATEVEGVVVEMQRIEGGSSRPVVEFTDHNGNLRTLYPNSSSNPPQFFVGERVTVMYDPSDPRYPVTARIKSLFTLWFVSIFFVVFGLFWMLVASLSWYVHSKGGVIYFGGHKEDLPATSSVIQNARRALENSRDSPAISDALQQLADNLHNECLGLASRNQESGHAYREKQNQLGLLRQLLGQDAFGDPG